MRLKSVKSKENNNKKNKLEIPHLFISSTGYIMEQLYGQTIEIVIMTETIISNINIRFSINKIMKRIMIKYIVKLMRATVDTY